MEPYSNPFEPINLLVVLRRAPRLVLPSVDTPRTVLQLSALNAHVGYGSILSSHMLLFEAHRHNSFTTHEVISPSHSLARGLEKVLGPYYPLAGRVRLPSGAGVEQGKLELACNAMGAIFVEAQANLSLAELRKLDKVFWSELHYDYVGEASMEVCPLVVQVTMLTCGGFVVSVRVLQSLLDSAGMLHFFHAWSEMTKTLSPNVTIATPIWGGKVPAQLAQWPVQKFHFPSLEPLHFPSEYVRVDDRHTLQYVETRDHAFYDSVHADHKLHYIDRRDYPHHDRVQAPSMNGQRLLPLEARDRHPFHENVLGLSNVSISLEHLSLLKDSIYGSCNKFEALAALFWRERTRVLGLAPSTEMVLFFPAPVAHDVHLAFYGLYGFNCVVSAQAGELIQSGLSEVVRMIQEAKAQLLDNFVECMRMFAQLHVNGAKHAPPHVLLFTVLWGGVEDIDFGIRSAPYAADAARLHSPVNVVAITGGLEDTVEVVMTNAPTTLADKINLHLLSTSPSLLSDSKL